MEERVAQLKAEGLTLNQIAQELGVSVGKVQYAWRKWRTANEMPVERTKQAEGPKKETPMKKKKATSSKVKPSRSKVADRNRETVAEQSRAEVATTQSNEAFAHESISSPLLDRTMDGFVKLPERYNRDMLHAIVQSPNAVYVFWELAESTKRTIELQFMRSWEHLPKELRILDVTLKDYARGHVNRSYTFELPEMTNGWFVRPLDPNTTYVFEFGIRTIEGEFIPLVSSEPLDTPRAEPGTQGRFAEPVRRWQYGETSSPELLETLPKYAAYNMIK